MIVRRSPALIGCLVLCLSLFFTGRALAQARSFPPGQEALFSEILGAGVALPGGCAWDGAFIRGGRVASRYVCGPERAVVELEITDRRAAQPSATLTRELAISLRKGGSEPPGLVGAIAERARAREAELRWVTHDLPPSAAPKEARRIAANVASTAARLGLGGARLARIAWIALAIWIALRAAALAVRRRLLPSLATPDALTFAGVSIAALAVRLAVPSGPLDFAEPERLSALWSVYPEIDPTFASLASIMGLQREMGLSPALIFRLTGPLSGALGAGAAYLLARAIGARRATALTAATIVAVWPAHVRYSGGGSPTVLGAALWTLAFAALAVRSITLPWKLPLAAALVVLGVHTRPEYRLLALALVPFTFLPGWTWRRRAIVLGALALCLVPYAAEHGLVSAPAGDATRWTSFFGWALRDGSVSPRGLLVLGLLGLLLARAAWPARAGLFVATSLLVIGYARFGSENNPLWGEWRYLVSVVPFVAVAAASLLERLPRVGRRDLGMIAATSLAALTLVTHARLLLRPIDLQAEHAYLRESAPAIARVRHNLVVLTDDGQPEGSTVHFEGALVMALALSLGPADWPARSAAFGPPEGAPKIWAPWALMDASAVGPAPEDSALFLGLQRDEALLARIRARYDIVAIDEHDADVAPAVPAVSTACRGRTMDIVGASLPDCRVRFGWYRLVPVSGR